MTKLSVTYKGTEIRGWRRPAAVLMLFGAALIASFLFFGAVVIAVATVPLAMLQYACTGKWPRWHMRVQRT